MLAALLTNLQAPVSPPTGAGGGKGADERLWRRYKDEHELSDEIDRALGIIEDRAPLEVKKQVRKVLRPVIKKSPQKVTRIDSLPPIDYGQLMLQLVLVERLFIIYQDWIDEEEAILALLLS